LRKAGFAERLFWGFLSERFRVSWRIDGKKNMIYPKFLKFPIKRDMFRIVAAFLELKHLAAAYTVIQGFLKAL